MLEESNAITDDDAEQIHANHIQRPGACAEDSNGSEHAD
jgi:hypothetical protein